ncbi:hypothetical protein [Cupriavidus basilensis]|uniref:Uncharacterized protein n=1 Tax=Cupriavidus basilensis TaxID=68895 RepID=A0A643FY55_9BURK|nr:hypothetical protein [Cupriavidus basilensis]QOT79279.1 hypothetical protein F7R26_031550 [Cupriavidus basilensis]
MPAALAAPALAGHRQQGQKHQQSTQMACRHGLARNFDARLKDSGCGAGCRREAPDQAHITHARSKNEVRRETGKNMMAVNARHPCKKYKPI